LKARNRDWIKKNKQTNKQKQSNKQEISRMNYCESLKFLDKTNVDVINKCNSRKHTVQWTRNTCIMASLNI